MVPNQKRLTALANKMDIDGTWEEICNNPGMEKEVLKEITAVAKSSKALISYCSCLPELFNKARILLDRLSSYRRLHPPAPFKPRSPSELHRRGLIGSVKAAISGIR